MPSLAFQRLCLAWNVVRATHRLPVDFLADFIPFISFAPQDSGGGKLISIWLLKGCGFPMAAAARFSADVTSLVVSDPSQPFSYRGSMLSARGSTRPRAEIALVAAFLWNRLAIMPCDARNLVFRCFLVSVAPFVEPTSKAGSRSNRIEVKRFWIEVERFLAHRTFQSRSNVLDQIERFSSRKNDAPEKR